MSPTLEADFFNIARQPDVVILEHIADAIDEREFTVLEVRNHDTVIYMDIKKGKWEGKIRIDRVEQSYEVSLVAGSDAASAKVFKFADVETYLQSF